MAWSTLQAGSGWTATLLPARLRLDDAQGRTTLALTAAEIARGGAVRSRVAAPVGTTRDLGVAVERVEARAEGVELTWTFDTPPPGDGDLEIRVGIEGMALVREDADALHLAATPASADAAGVRISRAVLVDATGRRTALPTDFDGGALRVRVRDDLLAQSAYPIVVDPVVSPEIALSPPHEAGSVVVWVDDRALGAAGDIYGARVTTEGTVLDPSGAPIARPASRCAPRAAISPPGSSAAAPAATCTRSGSTARSPAARSS